MASIKRDDEKQKWEETEFPLVCETCLGDNAYVRMTKEEHGKKCKICDNPFTVFAWQAGTKGRLKKVEICRSCAQAKNVCQVCIYDLQYGLPVKVRDKILKESGSAGATIQVPQSQANRAWYSAQQERLLAQGQNLVGEANAMAHAQLSSIARMEPRYERNLPKLCSFFSRGECNRGADCPFRHEMPRDRNDPLSKQNTKDRFHGTNDPAAAKLWARLKAKEAEEKANNGDQDGNNNDEYEQARATLYLRFQGEEPYPQLTEDAIRDQFYSFGEIVSVRIQADKGQAFVEYTQPEATELAISSMNRKELLNRSIFVAWARAPKRGNQAVSSRTEQQESAKGKTEETPRVIRPPPGATKAVPLPKGLAPVKPPPEVAAIAAARRAAGVAPVPRPGGGVIRGAGVIASKKGIGSTQPYYPSADPARLGTRASGSSSQS
jgi:pre-mRNA-splicing factor RBM22/SLT11